MNSGVPSAIDIHARLAAFDGWLTGRIEEAHASRKDLAFRDLPPDDSPRIPWEYSLLEPGARSPIGEGWSVYRFSGVMPPPLAEEAPETGSSRSARRSVIDVIASAVRRRPPR
jgi:hypothetical protein